MTAFQTYATGMAGGNACKEAYIQRNAEDNYSTELPYDTFTQKGKTIKALVLAHLLQFVFKSIQVSYLYTSIIMVYNIS